MKSNYKKNIMFFISFGIFIFLFYYFIQGKELYFSYGFSFFLFFVLLLQVGFLYSFFSITKKYQELGYYKQKKKLFDLGLKSSLLIGVVVGVVGFVFSDNMARFIFSFDLDKIKFYTLTLKTVFLGIMLLPVIGFLQGYLMAHNLKKNTIISFILQIVSIIVFTCIYSSDKLLLGKEYMLSWGILFSSIVVLTYIVIMYVRNKVILNKETMKIKEKEISIGKMRGDIVRRFFKVLPLSLLYFTVYFLDITNIGRIMRFNGDYPIGYIDETIIGFAFWGFLINIFLTFWLTSIIFSNKTLNVENVKKRIPIFVQKIILISSVIFITSFVGDSIWDLMFGISTKFYSYYIFLSLASLLFICSSYVLLILKEKQKFLIYSFMSILIKIIFNIPLFYTFIKIGYPGYYGFITSTVISSIIYFGFSINYIAKKYKISLENTLSKFLNIFIMVFVYAIILFVFKNILYSFNLGIITDILLLVVYFLLINLIISIFTSKSK